MKTKKAIKASTVAHLQKKKKKKKKKSCTTAPNSEVLDLPSVFKEKILPNKYITFGLNGSSL